MSLPSTTGQRALDVPATPGSPLTQASLGRAPQVLTQAPLGTQKVVKPRLFLYGSDTGSPERTTQYFTQVYGAPKSAIVSVSTWDDVERELNACSSIGELLILSHAVFDAISLDGVQLTPNQFADRFAPIAPTIGSLQFDGCVIGTDLVGMHNIALRMKIDEVRGWTWWHYVDWWRMTGTGSDPAANLALFQPLAAVASPWLPRSRDGLTVYSQADQEPLFSANKLNLIGEYFIGELGQEAKPGFVAAVQAGTLDPNKHRPRGTCAVRRVDSAAAQGAVEIELAPYPPLLARVIMTPWT
jgi:hypothetical protein